MHRPLVAIMLLLAGCGEPGASEDWQDDSAGDAIDEDPPHPVQGDAGDPRDGTTTETKEPNGTGANGTKPPSPPESRYFEVSVFDYASALQHPNGAYVEVNGTTWEPDLSYGSDGPHEMGEFVVGERHDDGLVVYPDGSSGVACAVDFMVVAEEDPDFDGVTQVEIDDDEVWIYGQAIPAHRDWQSAYVCLR